MEPDLVDLVNENDEVIGIIDRNDKEFLQKKNVRGVELFLLTKENKLVIPKRSANRRIFPNCYDYSAAGMVDSGEDYETAMYRELKEELYTDNISLKEIAYLNPYKSESKMFIKLYIGYIKDEIKNFDHDGITDIYYFKIEELDQLLKENPEQFKGTFAFSFQQLKAYFEKNEKSE